nr:MAG TPA: hypothetical protein [Caudoviricetes sp.]
MLWYSFGTPQLAGASTGLHRAPLYRAARTLRRGIPCLRYFFT